MSADLPGNPRIKAAGGKRPRIVLYPHAEKARLLAEVAHLCRALDRPVSPKDLLAHFRAHPERRPLLMQGLGQVLLKAARPRGQPTPVLRKMGLVGNLAFFVPAGEGDEAAACWKEKLDLHALGLAVEKAAKLDLPARALTLFGTEHEALARHALAGFLAEWQEKVHDPRLASQQARAAGVLRAQVEVAARHARAGDHHPSLPGELIGRAQAEDILRAEYAARNPEVEPGWLSVNRHLARLAALRPVGAQTGFPAAQVHAYVGARWPRDAQEESVARALFVCGAYGTQHN